MGEGKSGSGLPFNWTSLLALFTVVGGLAIVSRHVTSDRPSTTVEASFQSVGNQRVQARLWEDPLGWQTNQAQASGAEAFRLLRQQIELYSNGTNRPMLLPVMLHGGPYSEDQEKRIRSRFAVVSALGESGYAPEDADHVGAINIPWPAGTDLEPGWRNSETSVLRLLAETNSSTLPELFPPCSGNLRIGFEWYRSRDFYGGGSPSPRFVLLLWLDEDAFDDYPAIRLALLLNELATATNSTPPDSGLFSSVKLIGPRSSDTLRALLPRFGSNNFSSVMSGALQTTVKQVLQQVDVYCATASAMDEVLVAGSSNAPPRQLVARALTNFWFHSFNNFSCTDAQLAQETLAELKLRNIDLKVPAKPIKNLVLISEWDTFFGRMLSLTYAAELAKYQNPAVFPSDMNFVTTYRTNESVWPTNLFSFVYLRGLDGQTTKPVAANSTGNEGQQPPSLEDLKHGDTSQSKAAGQSQFDYLTRLGDRMQAMEKDLSRQGRGRFDAIGIVGSDDYDTLVILEALRDKFSDAVFFTTELDARFAHPAEQKWARNLLVMSSYGLQLNEGLQNGVAPFRESAQTAEFAATLSALGNTRLGGLTNIPPRRFEIGRAQAFDLSINDDFPQPKPLAKTGFSRPAKSIAGCVLGLLAGGFLLSLIWRPLGRLTWDHDQFETERLWLKEEDLGSLPGFKLLYENLGASDDEFARWLFHAFAGTTKSELPPPASEKTFRQFLDFLNQKILQDNLPAEKVAASKLISASTREAFVELLREKQSSGVFLAKNSQGRLRMHARIVDEVFNHLLGDDTAGVHGAGQAGRHARVAGLELFHFRRFRRWGIWIGVPLVAALFVLLCNAALKDNRDGLGEPFLFWAGISVWPTEIMRLAVAVLAVIFLLNSYAKMRTCLLDLTQRYRLPLARQPAAWLWRLPSTPPPQATVDAVKLWEHYQQLGEFWPRVRRIVFPFLFYFLLAIGIALQFGHTPYSPVRGPLCISLDRMLLMASIVTYLFLTFWLIDAARLCRWLIEYLSESPTDYPPATLDYFAEQRGLKTQGNPGETVAIDEQTQILSEWIDLQLIAELTERIGRLVYYPFILFFILLVSRNNWWAHWTWPPGLVLIFSLNLLLAAMSILILQRSALKARDICVAKLRAKVEKAEQHSAATPTSNRAERGRKLLEEIETLQTGAFAPLWQNPVIGAALIPSGGSVLLELLNNLFR